MVWNKVELQPLVIAVMSCKAILWQSERLSASPNRILLHTVTYVLVLVARQRHGKHIASKHTRATGRRLLGKWAVNMPLKQSRLCFLSGPCRGVVKEHRRRGRLENSSRVKSRISRRQPARIWAWEQRNWIQWSLRNWQLQNNGKK
jgi:hypothetical protein